MNDDKDNQKHICFQCVGEEYLAQQIEKGGENGKCSYCGQLQACMPINELADRIEVAFRDHYVCTPDEPDSMQRMMMSDREYHYNWERDGQPVLEAIEEAADIPEEAAMDVVEVLDDRYQPIDPKDCDYETEFSSETYYERRSASAQVWLEEWCNFEQSLKTEARFFSRSAAELLERVFERIDTLKTKQRHPLVVEAGPNRKLTQFYRARVFQSDADLKEALCRPDLHLGPPPVRLTRAGRMNAFGISVFYGATKASVALAEVRPPVGSDVAIAKFRIVRPLRLLDLAAIKDVWDEGSIFDPSLKTRLERIAFLKSIGERMTRPVMPNDEAFDYLPTQVVADYLATEREPGLDGIIFDSVQSKAGRNVVLFHKAARVEELVFPEGTKIEASTSDETEGGWEIDYSVSEEVPKVEEPAAQKMEEGLTGFVPRPGPRYSENADHREVTLSVDTSSIEVHRVECVEVKTERFEVTRHRYEKRDWRRKY